MAATRRRAFPQSGHADYGIRVQSGRAARFLRSSQAGAHFESRRKGTYVQIIQRSDLAELEIPLPTLAKQLQVAPPNQTKKWLV